MTNLNELEQLKQLIEAIPTNSIKKLDMPVGIYLQEAENLNITVKNDKSALLNRGLNASVINNLASAISALRQAEALWFNCRFQKKKAQKLWSEKEFGIYGLRNDLVDEFEFAFDGDNFLMGKVSDIKEGSGHADMIQDLANLAILGKSNPEPLKQTHFNMELLNKAEQEADNMANLLAKATSGKDDNKKVKLLRDKAYTYLKQHVDEIRRTGKFIFRKNREHIVKYQSSYYRNK